MKKRVMTFVAACLALSVCAQKNGHTGYPITPVPFTAVKVMQHAAPPWRRCWSFPARGPRTARTARAAAENGQQMLHFGEQEQRYDPFDRRRKGVRQRDARPQGCVLYRG